MSSRHAWARELATLLALKRPLVFLDVETTGPNTETDRIVQLGYLRIAVDGEVEEKETDLNPEREMSAENIAIHGIDNARASKAPRFVEIAEDLALLLLDADLGGYNVKFDARVLWHEFKRAKVTSGAPGQWARGEGPDFIDSFKIYRLKNTADLSAAVRRYLGEELHNAHTALADARAAARVFHAQIKEHEDLPRSVRELHDLLFETPPPGFYDVDKKIAIRDGKPVLNFGKRNGELLSEVPPDYLRWMLDSDFSPRVKELIREVLNERKRPAF